VAVTAGAAGKIILLSDVHSNREALEAVWEKVEKIRPDAVFHLGDLVGYGADPEFCVKFVMERFPVGVRGNHDAVACGRHSGWNFNGDAKKAALFSRKTISETSAKYLAGLPALLRFPAEMLPASGGAVLTHGAPSNPNKYVFDTYDAQEEVPGLRKHHPGVRAVFAGHTHVAQAAHLNEAGAPLYEDPWNVPATTAGMDRGKGYTFINAGSVGQPRDGDPRACFAVLDMKSGRVKWVRVEYDVEKCQHKILAAGLPEVLARRLARGS